MLSHTPCRGYMRYSMVIYDQRGDPGGHTCLYDAGTGVLAGYWGDHLGINFNEGFSCGTTAATYDRTGCDTVTCPQVALGRPACLGPQASTIRIVQTGPAGQLACCSNVRKRGT